LKPEKGRAHASLGRLFSQLGTAMRAARAVLLWAAAWRAAAAPSPVTDGVDWPSFLARHDPVWSYAGTFTTGYTELAATIGGGGASAACEAPACAAAGAACVEASATACDGCAACAAFALSSAWHNGTLAQFYGSGYARVPNAPWTTWAKGGPAPAVAPARPGFRQIAQADVLLAERTAHMSRFLPRKRNGRA
jgi:hypothetical protein